MDIDPRLMEQITAIYMADNHSLLNHGSSDVMLNDPAKVYDLVNWMAVLPQEHLRGILLDTKLHVISMVCIAIGSLNTASASYRDVFRAAIRLNAYGIILVHNHPSGDPTPSREDREYTRKAVAAGNLLSIKVLDHVVVGTDRYVSLKETYPDLFFEEVYL